MRFRIAIFENDFKNRHFFFILDIQVGDQLLAINDMSTEGLTSDDVSDMMSALSGPEVKLTVRTPRDFIDTDTVVLQTEDQTDGQIETAANDVEVHFKY